MSTASLQLAAEPIASADANIVSHPVRFHIASLDGIRGTAFLLVFLSHAGLGFVIPGGFGVTVFFVLSGFLITTLLRLEYDRTEAIDFGAFYLRRSLRILPLFYLVLLGALLLCRAGCTTGTLTRSAGIAQVVHWSNYYLIAHGADSVAGGTIVLWSLAVEEHFYLIFPLLYWQIRKRFRTRTQALILWGCCLLCLIWRYVLILGLHAPSVRTELGTDTRFDGLLFGAILAIAANPALDSARWFRPKQLKLLALASLFCLLFTFSLRDEIFRFTLRFTLQGLALLPVFAYAILARESRVFRFLNARVLTALGVLSYSLYLIHAILLNLFSQGRKHPGVLGDCIVFCIALALAKLLQIGVEKPLQQIRRRYSRVSA